MITLYRTLQKKVELFQTIEISDDRKETLQPLIDYIHKKIKNQDPVYLNFICTHNSRRSQFAQIWAQTAASYFNIDAKCFSGGVEVTEFHNNAIKSLKRSGFDLNVPEGENPIVLVSFNDSSEPIRAFSKLFDHKINQASVFAAVMTCSHADENCPFIPGTEKRIALNYRDPKEFDNSDNVDQMYDERSLQIGLEMWYIFNSVKEITK